MLRWLLDAVRCQFDVIREQVKPRDWRVCPLGSGFTRQRRTLIAPCGDLILRGAAWRTMHVGMEQELRRNERKYCVLGMVRRQMRLKRLSIRTEEAYLMWIRWFVAFHRKRHPHLSQLAAGGPGCWRRTSDGPTLDSGVRTVHSWTHQCRYDHV